MPNQNPSSIALPTHSPINRPYQKLSHHLSSAELSITLETKQNQLWTLLYTISAEGAEVFTHLPESVQALYLLTCTDMAQDCLDITQALAGEAH